MPPLEIGALAFSIFVVSETTGNYNVHLIYGSMNANTSALFLFTVFVSLRQRWLGHEADH
jgi:hypothetical protein